MNPDRLKRAGHEARRTRIVWRDGPFRLECAADGSAMRLSVYYGPRVMAEEAVDSAEAAWQRATDLCRRLGREQLAAGERGSA